MIDGGAAAAVSYDFTDTVCLDPFARFSSNFSLGLSIKVSQFCTRYLCSTDYACLRIIVNDVPYITVSEL